MPSAHFESKLYFIWNAYTNRVEINLREELARRLSGLRFARRVWSIFEVWKWTLKGKPVPIPSRVKQKIVKTYAKQFNLNILIETGTYLGDMVGSTQKFFNEIYSIELSNSLYERAKKRFSKLPHIHIVHGDSGKVLPNLLSSIQQHCLFWLDAHYSGGITAKGNCETSIIKELQCILNHPILDHVILIDDARFFIGQNGYPSLDELRELISKKRRDWIVQVKWDIIRIHRPLPQPASENM
jgi:hypothetical protein